MLPRQPLSPLSIWVGGPQAFELFSLSMNLLLPELAVEALHLVRTRLGNTKDSKYSEALDEHVPSSAEDRGNRLLANSPQEPADTVAVHAGMLQDQWRARHAPASAPRDV